MPRRSAVGAKKSRRRVRCAIYTRKSTEEGLEQEFNSLDAQREACETFVLSQKHEGWVALIIQYDDCGYSGGQRGRGRDRTIYLPSLSGLRSVRLLRKHLDEAHRQQAPHSAEWPGPMGASRLPGGHSISCCRTASIAARSCIRTSPTQASTTQSSMTISGRRCRRPWRRTRVGCGAGKGNRQLSLFAGLIYDAQGEPMTPSHAAKKGIRYRYYVSKSLLTGRDEKATNRGQRIPAAY